MSLFAKIALPGHILSTFSEHISQFRSSWTLQSESSFGHERCVIPPTSGFKQPSLLRYLSRTRPSSIAQILQFGGRSAWRRKTKELIFCTFVSPVGSRTLHFAVSRCFPARSTSISITAFLIDVLGAVFFAKTQSAPVDTCAHRSHAVSHHLEYRIRHRS